jgi:hypothetical protein
MTAGLPVDVGTEQLLNTRVQGHRNTNLPYPYLSDEEEHVLTHVVRALITAAYI